MNNSKYRKKLSELSTFIFSLIVPILILIIWELSASKGIIRETVLPRPSKIGSTIAKLTANGTLIKDIRMSLCRAFAGYIVGSFLGIVFGILIGFFNKVRVALNLLFEFLRPIPVIAWIPVLIMLFGIDEKSKIIVIAIGTFWPVLLNVIGGINNVDVKLVEVSSIFMKSKWTTITNVIIPASLPSIFTGLKIAAGNALMGVIGAEMFAASSGLGYMITYAREMAQPSKLFAGVFVIGILGYLINYIISKLETHNK